MQCFNQESCPIEPKTKHKCGWCRYKKCLEVGMRPNMIVFETKNKRKKMGIETIIKDNSDNLVESYPKSTSSDDSLSTVSLLTTTSSPVNYHIRSSSDYIWVNNSPGSRLEFQSFQSSNIYWYFFTLTIQVPVNESSGLIVGTELTIDSLLSNFDSMTLNNNKLSSQSLCLVTPKEMIVFMKSPSEVMLDTFSVQVISNSSFKMLSMEGMTQVLWETLEQVVSSSARIFQDVINVQHQIYEQQEPDEEEINGSLKMKKVLLVTDFQNYLKQHTQLFEELTFFQSLGLEDQIILLKENIMAAMTVINLYTHDRETDSKTRIAFRNRLVFRVQWKFICPQEYDYQFFYEKLLEIMDDVIRLDPFVMSLLHIIIFYQDKPGLTC